jgi:hypothetical protein
MRIRKLQKKRLVQEIEGELVVYDQQNHKVFHLNEAAAIVWEICEEVSNIEDLVSSFAARTKIPVDEAVVVLAIQELRDAQLIEGSFDGALDKKISRRELMDKMAHVAIALPLVVSMLAPTAAMAQSAPAAEPEPDPE